MSNDDVKPGGNVKAFPKTNPQSVPGMSPEFVANWDELVNGLELVICRAADQGLPPQLVLGQLLTIQADILDSMMDPEVMG
ncbi:MAG: hypothetical protein ACREA9_21110 [Pyrinomonadaceae bacterium]